MNCSAVVASSSVGHGPCGAAHTMDVMGVIMVSAQFGLQTDNGTLEATMDDTISWYNFTSVKVTLNDLDLQFGGRRWSRRQPSHMVLQQFEISKRNQNASSLLRQVRERN